MRKMPYFSKIQTKKDVLVGQIEIGDQYTNPSFSRLCILNQSNKYICICCMYINFFLANQTIFQIDTM